MKDHIQTILNVCFAISITAFIYQNDKQQDRIDSLEAQADINKSLKDIDALMYDLSILEVEVETHKERFVTVINYLDKIVDSVNDHETEMQNIAESSRSNSRDITSLEYDIRTLPKPKTTSDVITIIEGCKTSIDGYMGAHWHNSLKC